jgi:hypothetical protein
MTENELETKIIEYHKKILWNRHNFKESKEFKLGYGLVIVCNDMGLQLINVIKAMPIQITQVPGHVNIFDFLIHNNTFSGVDLKLNFNDTSTWTYIVPEVMYPNYITFLEYFILKYTL